MTEASWSTSRYRVTLVAAQDFISHRGVSWHQPVVDLCNRVTKILQSMPKAQLESFENLIRDLSYNMESLCVTRKFEYLPCARQTLSLNRRGSSRKQASRNFCEFLFFCKVPKQIRMLHNQVKVWCANTYQHIQQSWLITDLKDMIERWDIFLKVLWLKRN